MHMIARLSRSVCLLAAMTMATACTGELEPAGRAPAQTTKESSPDSSRFVSPDGDDSWPGTQAQPWQTLGRAFPALYSGQVLYVRGGEYREELVKLRLHEGTPDRPIKVRNFPGERAVVRGLVWLRQPMYWKIRGLNVTWDPTTKPPPRAMVKVTGGVGWTWKKSEIWGSRGYANMLVVGAGEDEPAKWSILRNCIHDIRPPKGSRGSNLNITKMRAAGPGQVNRNIIFGDAGQRNVALGSVDDGATDLAITNNTIYGGKVAASFAGNSHGVHITRNILGGASSGILISWHSPEGYDNLVRQNLGIQPTRFLRPDAEPEIEGPGNVLAESVTFPDVSSCYGFHTEAGAALPYGRYAVG